MPTTLSTPDVFAQLGVETVINGRSWVTILGGSIMHPEVVQAMSQAADCYVKINDLNEKAGEVIAKHTGAEAGLVTAGAAAGMLLQAAACMTGIDPAKIKALPDSTGMPNEILIHRAHRIGFDQCYRIAGAKLVDWGDARSGPSWELEAAITERTAAIAYIFGPWLRQPLSLTEVVEIAHRSAVPVIVDASAMLPPKENLTRYIDQGADLVTFAGGKGLCGPQSTGILCGRADLVEAAKMNMSPNAGVGRPSKVCKEEIVGLITALERFVALDHEAQSARWRAMSQHIVDSVQDIPGIRPVVEDGDPNRLGPQAVVYFDVSWGGRSPKEIQDRLAEGQPPIFIGQGGYQDELWVTSVTLREGEQQIVAEKLRQMLL